jgi:hypothetical protein
VADVKRDDFCIGCGELAVEFRNSKSMEKFKDTGHCQQCQDMQELC